MKELLTQKVSDSISLLLLIIFLGGTFFMYQNYRYEELQQENSVLTNKIDNVNTALAKSITDIQAKNNILSGAFLDEQSRTISVVTDLQKVSGTVDVLQKLSQTDPQLLQKYSKVYFLNENYVPEQLTSIDPKYLFNSASGLLIHTGVYPHLQSLINSANASGLMHLQVISAYRSFGTQSTLKASYKVIYGTTKANQFSADQGYSEHQLGTAVDFTTPTVGASFDGFENSQEYAWLSANAYQYGFILSYPPNNKYYEFEPWHWRFVGVALATKLHNENKYFYDYDQHEIDTYLAQIFD